MAKKIRVVSANTSALRKAIFEVRSKVFVQEQKVDEKLEYDAFETSSTHLAALLDDKVVGTCRFRNTEKGVKLERFAVLKEYRGQAVGEHLVKHCLSMVKNEKYVYLNAQVPVVEFYAQFGFVQEGGLFVEAGIEHYKMVLKKITS